MERRGNETGGFYWQCKQFPTCRGALPETTLVKLSNAHERTKMVERENAELMAKLKRAEDRFRDLQATSGHYDVDLDKVPMPTHISMAIHEWFKSRFPKRETNGVGSERDGICEVDQAGS